MKEGKNSGIVSANLIIDKELSEKAEEILRERGYRWTGWDAVEAEELYRLLEEEVIPEFYTRDAAGIPHAWVTRMRASMMRLAPHFSTSRMMKEYVEKMCLPATASHKRRIGDDCRLARELHNWQSTLRQHWHGIHWGNLEVHEETDGWSFDVHVYLGGISPNFVQVQLFADPAGP